jgi:hypothetical protein
MRRKSLALREFQSSIEIVTTLIKREKKLQSLPNKKTYKEAQGLRGGAMVLLVAAFENYLKEVTEERLDDLTTHSKYQWTKLPNDLKYHNHFHTLYDTIHGSSKGKNKLDKMADLVKASTIIVNNQINSLVFCDVARSNPDSNRVNELFKSLGITHFFQNNKPLFDQRWGTPTIPTFMEERLDTILKQRHEVAHTANVMNISRLDLEEDVRFLVILTKICDDTLYNHVKTILNR